VPNNISQDDLISMIQSIQSRLNRIENSSQLGNVSIQAGALQIIDPLGRLVAALGYQPDGSIGLGIYNPVTGIRQMALGQTPGEPSLYALSVLNAAGVLQQVAGVVTDTVAGLLTMSSPPTGYVDLGGPFVTATVGPSGQALCSIFAFTDIGIASSCTAAVGIDGSLSPPTSSPYIQSLGVGGGGNGLSLASSSTITGLSAGVHTFRMLYTASGNSPSWNDSTLIIQAL
jgi:hypothetical protein